MATRLQKRLKRGRDWFRDRAKGVDYAEAGSTPHRLRAYLGADGTFDYEYYKRVQTEGNKRKLANVFADEATCRVICDALIEDGVKVARALCHGSRNGAELKWFADMLGCEATGTDISDTATQFENMVQWDFHEPREEWKGAFDLVYTNSHDHAYDPVRALRTWAGQLAPGGRLVVEHTDAHLPGAVNELDPFGIEAVAFPYFVLEASEGGTERFAVRRVVRPDHKKKGRDIWLFLIGRD